jgi:chromosome partitioning protein
MLSDIILVPVSPSALDIWAAQEAIKTIREARAERGGKLPKIVLVPSRVLTRSSLGRDIADTLKAFGEPVSPAISSRVAIAESAIAGLPISVYAPKSAGHNEFLNLWKFVSSEIRK